MIHVDYHKYWAAVSTWRAEQSHNRRSSMFDEHHGIRIIDGNVQLKDKDLPRGTYVFEVKDEQLFRKARLKYGI